MGESQVLKVVLIGDGGVGKSSIMTRYITGKYEAESYHTIGVEFLNKELAVEGKNFMLQIWDTAGQERFKSLRTPFYRGADCCMLVFAVDDEQSFKNLQLWKNEFLFYSNIEDTNKDFPFVVLANKCDVDNRAVTEAEAREWCSENGNYTYIETSAKDATNVIYCFETAVRRSMQIQRAEASISNLTSGTPSVNLKTMARNSNKNSGNCC